MNPGELLMEMNSLNRDNLNTEEEIIKEAKYIYIDVLYSEKARFQIANFWHQIHYLTGSITIILSIVLVSLAFIDITKYLIIVWALSLTTTIFTMLQIFFNPYDKSKINKNIGDEYNKLRREIRIFYNINIPNNDHETNIDQLNEFVEKKFKLDNQSPPILNYFYGKAKKSIEKGEHEYGIDNEIR